MWFYGVPDVVFAAQGATVLRFSSSLSRAFFLSIPEKCLLVIATVSLTNQRKGHSGVFTSIVSGFLLFLISIVYIPLYILALAVFILEFFTQAFLSVITYASTSHSSFHRSFAHPFELLEMMGLYQLPHSETEVIGMVTTNLYESCIKQRDWKGVWPIYYITLENSEETEIEVGIEPFARAISESARFDCTVVKCGSFIIRIGGRLLRRRLSIAQAIGAELLTTERKITHSLGRMYDAYNFCYKVNKVSLSDSAVVDNVRAFSVGERSKKLVYTTQSYSTAFRELSDQIKDYPLTIDIARSDEVEVVRSNIVLLKNFIGAVFAFTLGGWYGLRTIIVQKDVEKLIFMVAVYALFAFVGFVPVFGKDRLRFGDVLRARRRRVIEAVLHSTSTIGTHGKDGWNYRGTFGSVDLGPLSVEESVLTARFCAEGGYIWAMDTCSLSFFRALATEGDSTLHPEHWEVESAMVNIEGDAKRVSAVC